MTYNLDWASKSAVDALVSHACGRAPLIDGSNAAELLAMADRLQVSSLHAACEEALLTLLTSSNAEQLLELAANHHCSKLKSAVEAYVDDTKGSGVLSSLVERRFKAQQKLKDIEKRQQGLKNEHFQATRAVNEIKDQESFERERMFKASAASAVLLQLLLIQLASGY